MRWGWVVVIAVVSFALGVAGTRAVEEWWEGDPPAAELPLSPNPGAELMIVAAGDSFISGEGASAYYMGTNGERNGCRRTWSAYPYQVASDFSADLRFVACSGARIRHVLSEGQYPDSPTGVVGATAQLEQIEEAADRADVVLLSIGGNDAGFGEIVQSCIRPDRAACDEHPERWLDRLPGIEASLVAAYGEVERAAPGAQLFVLTYPQPLGPRYCSASLLDRDEYDFLARRFIPALNATIVRAAGRADVPVIDVTNAFRGVRLCEVVPQKSALNRLELPATHNSFHPNEIGHALLAGLVGRELLLAGFGAMAAPAADETAVPVTLASDEAGDDEDAAAAPTTSPEATAGSVPAGSAGPPAPAATSPAATVGGEPPADCPLVPTTPMELAAATTSIRISEAAPGATICHRTGEGDWTVTTADGGGAVDIPIDDPTRPLVVETVFVDRTNSVVSLTFRLAE